MFMIASNTKALTTLMLAKLVDEGKISWDTPVTTLLPSFKLGDADTTRRVLVKNLICACTGLPRQDFEWLFQYKGVTAEDALKTLGTMQPTTNSARCSSTRTRLPAPPDMSAGTSRFRRLPSAPRTTRPWPIACLHRSG
jgi:CubicO group peptidase (beta-lactamase class C family)